MQIKEVKLFDADSFEYSGSIIVNGKQWEYSEVTNEHMISVTSGMPLKAALACLISFNLVYDIIEEQESAAG
ncbi:MAG: hypothetical protein GY754_05215 [bacterium]|nr:hypothetical protein [bacterium]